jgi:hypothetical protein
MKKVALILILLMCTLIPLFAANPVQEKLDEALNKIGPNHYQTVHAGFGNFTYEYTGMGSEFSRYIQDQLGTAIAHNFYFELFVHDALENLDAAFKEVYGELFSEEQFNAMISGKYFVEDDVVRLSIEVVSFLDGYLIGKECH